MSNEKQDAPVSKKIYFMLRDYIQQAGIVGTPAEKKEILEHLHTIQQEKDPTNLALMSDGLIARVKDIKLREGIRIIDTVWETLEKAEISIKEKVKDLLSPEIRQQEEESAKLLGKRKFYTEE